MLQCLLFLCFIGIIIFLLIFLTKDSYNTQNQGTTPERGRSENFKGLCLFDIDGTLTTGHDNSKSVDICLKNGWAVGISTAGAMYKPENLLSFSWMPPNLFEFMKKYNWVTFNNVAAGIYAGKYKNQPNLDHMGHKKWGILKGYSLLDSAKYLNLEKGKEKLILFDNDPLFLQGLSYQKDLIGICAGYPCSKQNVLNPNLVNKVITKDN